MGCSGTGVVGRSCYTHGQNIVRANPMDSRKPETFGGFDTLILGGHRGDAEPDSKICTDHHYLWDGMRKLQQGG